MWKCYLILVAKSGANYVWYEGYVQILLTEWTVRRISGALPTVLGSFRGSLPACRLWLAWATLPSQLQLNSGWRSLRSDRIQTAKSWRLNLAPQMAWCLCPAQLGLVLCWCSEGRLRSSLPLSLFRCGLLYLSLSLPDVPKAPGLYTVQAQAHPRVHGISRGFCAPGRYKVLLKQESLKFLHHSHFLKNSKRRPDLL